MNLFVTDKLLERIEKLERDNQYHWDHAIRRECLDLIFPSGVNDEGDWVENLPKDKFRQLAIDLRDARSAILEKYKEKE